MREWCLAYWEWEDPSNIPGTDRKTHGPVAGTLQAEPGLRPVLQARQGDRMRPTWCERTMQRQTYKDGQWTKPRSNPTHSLAGDNIRNCDTCQEESQPRDRVRISSSFLFPAAYYDVSLKLLLNWSTDHFHAVFIAHFNLGDEIYAQYLWFFLNLIRHTYTPSSIVAWCRETEEGHLWFSLGSPSPVLSHCSVPPTQGASAGAQRQWHDRGIGKQQRKDGSLGNLSGRNHDCSVHLYLIHVPRTKFHRGQTNTLDSRTANKSVLHFVLKAKTNKKTKRKKGQNRDRVEGDASYKYKGFKENGVCSMSWRSSSWCQLLRKEKSLLEGNRSTETCPTS